MLQFVGGGLDFKVVAQGQAETATFPISTPAFDTAKHLCWLAPTVGYSGPPGGGGFYTWNGSSITCGTWARATPHWPSAVWQIWQIKNLASPIQAITGNVDLLQQDGWGNFDVTISPLHDYTKAVVIPCSWGYAQTGTDVQGYITRKYEYLLNNTTLRRRISSYNFNGAGVGNVYFSTYIVPTR